MRIISPFQDYYDGVQQYGHDRALVYDRRTVEHKIVRGSPHRPAPPFLGDDVLPPIHWERPAIEYREPPPHRWGRHAEPKFAMLYFCGKAYPFWIVNTAVKNKPNETITTYSFEPGFDDLVRKRDSSRWWWDTKNKVVPGEHTDWLAKVTGSEIDPAIHFAYSAPVLLYIPKEGDDFLIVNPCLKDHRIQKLIDPYTAFQELDMFMGGVLGSIEKDGPPMTDVQKVSAHGMDPKWSFRKKSDAK